MRLDEANRRAPPLLDLDELNYGFPPWFARGHSITVDEAMRLAAIIGIEYCERFRLEIGVAIQMTAERLIRKQLDEFLELGRGIDYRNLDESLNVLIGRHDFPGRVAAVALNSTLSHKFGDDWRTNSRIERLAKVLIADLKRKRGRPDSAAVAVFLARLWM
jgi:hypothetical protein